MGHVPRIKVYAKDPDSIVRQMDAIMHVLDGLVEFGNPSNPNDDSSTARADGVTHNGTLFNIKGSFVELSVEATGRTTHTCTHNLGLQNLGAPLSNVRWLVFGWLHDGTGAVAATELDLAVWYMGGTISGDAIDLEVSVNVIAGALTINADHPVKLTLFFHPAVR